MPLLELKSILLERNATLIDLKDTLSFIVDEEASGRWHLNHSNSNSTSGGGGGGGGTSSSSSNSALLDEVYSSGMNNMNNMNNVIGDPAYCGEEDDNVNIKNVITSSNSNERHDGNTTTTTTTKYYY